MIKKSDKQRVYLAYNEIIDWMEQARTQDLSLEQHYLDMIVQYLPECSSVLDVGCGTGKPLAAFF